MVRKRQSSDATDEPAFMASDDFEDNLRYASELAEKHRPGDELAALLSVI